MLFLAAVIFVLRNHVRRDINEESLTYPDMPETGRKKKKVPCVLCGSDLYRGETLKSHEFKQDRESIIHIYGCHNCYGETASKSRTCPVCKKAMDDKSYLIGRMWIKKNGKRHLHVSGCTRCV